MQACLHLNALISACMSQNDLRQYKFRETQRLREARTSQMDELDIPIMTYTILSFLLHSSDLTSFTAYTYLTMADITFSSQKLPHSWTILASNDKQYLAYHHARPAWPILTGYANGTWIAILSKADTPEDVLANFYRYPDTFIDNLANCAGIIWQPKAGKLCVFRDKFGFIPMMLIRHSDDSLTITTSPEFHDHATKTHALNRAYFGRFLRLIDSTSTDDVFEHTERILPGEIRHFLIPSNPYTAHVQTCRTSCYWNRRHYAPFNKSYHDLAHELRDVLVDAASRMPSDNPVFTLSGGLDSSGILAAFCNARKPISVDAISLVSQRHGNCDESHELDILERAFPIQLKRVNMDHAWPLSEPQLYTKYHAYGPHVAPGIESTLALYRTIETHFGSRTIITGYGGNFIVKVRDEALWSHLFTTLHQSRQSRSDLIAEICALRPSHCRTLLARCLGNIADGKIKAFFKQISCPIPSPSILQPIFAAQFPSERIDPVFAMSHCQERAWLPISWEWEMCTRALDMIARETSHAYYDPLFDPRVYDFCAQIPPQFFLKCHDYRTIYKDALRSLLPPEIIQHPKIQSFDDLMLDGFRTHAKALIQEKIDDSPNWVQEIIKTSELSKQFSQFCELSTNRTTMPYPISNIWRALSTCIWST